MELRNSLATFIISSDTWRRICGPVAVTHIDTATVEYVQGRSPVYSTVDEHHINGLFETGQLFPSVTDPVARAALRGRLCMTQTIIPSLHTFLEDTKLLEPCAKIMRALLPPKYRGTIMQGFIGRYSQVQAPGAVPMQEGDGTLTPLQGFARAGTFWAAYRQLWLSALRIFPDVTDVKPRKDKGKIPNVRQPGPEDPWYELAELAVKVGFESPEILRHLSIEPTRKIAIDFLRHARPIEEYVVGQGGLLTELQTIDTLLRGISRRTTIPDAPSLTTDTMHTWRLETRCGRTYEQAFYHDRKHMYLRSVYLLERHRRQCLTSLGVTCDIFIAFFGALPRPLQTLEQGALTPSHDPMDFEVQSDRAPPDPTRAPSGNIDAPYIVQSVAPQVSIRHPEGDAVMEETGLRSRNLQADRIENSIAEAAAVREGAVASSHDHHLEATMMHLPSDIVLLNPPSGRDEYRSTLFPSNGLAGRTIDAAEVSHSQTSNQLYDQEELFEEAPKADDLVMEWVASSHEIVPSRQTIPSKEIVPSARTALSRPPSAEPRSNTLEQNMAAIEAEPVFVPLSTWQRSWKPSGALATSALC